MESILVKSVIHSHDIVQDKIKKIRTMQSIINRANSTTERASHIISNHISNIQNDNTINIMPNITTMRDNIRRLRNNLVEYVPNVHQDIPESLKRDARGELFLRFDSGCTDPNRIVIFCAQYKIQNIEKINTFVIDGTFRSSPQGFYQLVVLHGYIFRKTFPFIYILMSNKTERSYLQAFDACKNLFNISPKFIITDFERALINSTSSSFNHSDSFGCLFHLGQALWSSKFRINIAL